MTKEEFMQDFDIKMTEMDEIIKNNCKEDDIKQIKLDWFFSPLKVQGVFRLFLEEE